MADRRRNLGIPAGVVFPFAGTTAPYGYVLCHGQAVSRTEYASLFLALGTTHGAGDGSTTFNLPDYRGRFLRGVSAGTTRDPDRGARTAMAAGGSGGDNVGSIQGDQLRSHDHQALSYEYHHGVDPGGSYWRGVTWRPTTATGGNETRPVNANVNYIIKV